MLSPIAYRLRDPSSPNPFAFRIGVQLYASSRSEQLHTGTSIYSLPYPPRSFATSDTLRENQV